MYINPTISYWAIQEASLLGIYSIGLINIYDSPSNLTIRIPTDTNNFATISFFTNYYAMISKVGNIKRRLSITLKNFRLRNKYKIKNLKNNIFQINSLSNKFNKNLKLLEYLENINILQNTNEKFRHRISKFFSKRFIKLFKLYKIARLIEKNEFFEYERYLKIKNIKNIKKFNKLKKIQKNKKIRKNKKVYNKYKIIKKK